MKTLLKWAGGKERELKFIIPKLPQEIENYYEPFLGGGAVFFNIEDIKGRCYLNDVSLELINFYISVKQQDRVFLSSLKNLDSCWAEITKLFFKVEFDIVSLYTKFKNNQIEEDDISEFIDLYSKRLSKSLEKEGDREVILEREIYKSLKNKFKRTKKLEKEKFNLPSGDILNIFLSAIKSGYYTFVRALYNAPSDFNVCKSEYNAIFLFIRMYCYSSMFRYNAKGEFNVPYGGIGYNKNMLRKKIAYYKSSQLAKKLSNVNFHNKDFEDFLNTKQLNENDFIFLDPPYDTEFSTYAKNEFSKSDQKRLADCLINSTGAKWMLVIKATDFIISLYKNSGLNIETIDKKYNVSFMDRNVKDATHLIIRNYK